MKVQTVETVASFSMYDAARKVWHQSGVTHRGQLLVIEAKLQADAMLLAGSHKSSSGEETLVRGTWKPLNGGVRETAVTSIDGSQNRNSWFDLCIPASDKLFRQR